MSGLLTNPRVASKRRGLTGRALVLGAVIVLMALLLAAPLQRYVAQRAAVSEAQREQAALEKTVADLEQQNAQWNDPAYVEQQARQRLQFAMPGDTIYQIIGPDGKPVDSTAANSTTAPTTSGGGDVLPGDTWSKRLWGSLQAADAK